jgi:hypothetical protein
MIQEGKTGSKVSRMRQSSESRAARVHEDVMMMCESEREERESGVVQCAMRQAIGHKRDRVGSGRGPMRECLVVAVGDSDDRERGQGKAASLVQDVKMPRDGWVGGCKRPRDKASKAKRTKAQCASK